MRQLPQATALALAVTCASLAPASLSAQSATTAHTQPQMTISAEATVEATPDMATIRIGVERRADSAETAMAEVSQAVADMLTRVETAGIAARDVQTQGLSLGPIYDRGYPNQSEPRLQGYQAANGLSIRLRDLSQAGEVLDALIGDGANRLDGITFGLQDPGPILDEARRNAVAEARRKAALYAEAAGMELGTLLVLQEPAANSFPPLLHRQASMMASDSAMPIAEGALAITATVIVTYALTSP